MDLETGNLIMNGEVMKLFRTEKEEDEYKVKVQGNLPEWATGTYWRVGPGIFDLDHCTMVHIYDGFAMLTKIVVTANHVSVTKRFVQSDSYKRAIALQKPVSYEYYTRPHSDPDQSIFKKMITSIIPTMTDNCVTNMNIVGKDVYCVNEFGFQIQVDPETLTRTHKLDAFKTFGVSFLSPHPMTDDDGYTYNIGLSVLSGLKYHVLKFPPHGKGQSSHAVFKAGKTIASFACRNRPEASWFHSFGMTKNYLVFIEQPIIMNVAKALQSIITNKSQCLRDQVSWKPEQKNRFTVIEKRTGKVCRIEIISDQAFSFVHFTNCWEESGEIVVDILASTSIEIMDYGILANLRNGKAVQQELLPKLKRFYIPIACLDGLSSVQEDENILKRPGLATAVKKQSKLILTPDVICNLGMEAYAINGNYSKKAYRYIWASGVAGFNKDFNKLFKLDLVTGEIITKSGTTNQFFTEPKFIPDPKGRDEDSGVLILVCHHIFERKGEKDFLLILDAKSLEEKARAEFNVSVPFCFHSDFKPPSF